MDEQRARHQNFINELSTLCNKYTDLTCPQITICRTVMGLTYSKLPTELDDLEKHCQKIIEREMKRIRQKSNYSFTNEKSLVLGSMVTQPYIDGISGFHGKDI